MTITTVKHAKKFPMRLLFSEKDEADKLAHTLTHDDLDSWTYKAETDVNKDGYMVVCYDEHDRRLGPI